MNRYLILPLTASVAFAQQQPVSEAEKNVQAQATRYYQLMMDKKFREAEKLVAEDSKEDYYNGRKPDIRGFSIVGTRMVDAQHAVVTIKAKQVVLMMGAGAQILEIPSPSNWKLEDGEWRWFIPEEMKNRTPFGKLGAGDRAGGLDLTGKAPGTLDSPDYAAIQGQLKVDKNSLNFDSEERSKTFIVQNGLSGPVDLELDPHVKTIPGLSVQLERSHLEAGQATTATVKLSEGVNVNDQIALRASPLNIVVTIRIQTK